MSENPRKAKTRTPPQLPDEEQAAVLDALRSGENYLDVIARGLALQGVEGEGIQIESARFDGGTLAEARLTGLKLVDARFERCDLSNGNWRGANFNRVEIVNCRALGLNAQESRLRDTLFAGSNLSFADLHRSTMSYSVFEECLLKGADLSASNLEGTRFSGCDLREADFTDCRLRGADVRGSQIEGLRVNAKDVAGLIVDVTQAVELSSLLKLVIK